MSGIATLQDMRYPTPAGIDSSGKPQTINVGILPIDNPSWRVILDFVRSETAIQKSSSNEPTVVTVPRQAPLPNQTSSLPRSDMTTQGGQLVPLPASSGPVPTEESTSTIATPNSPPTPPQAQQITLPAIDFQRVKTLISFKLDVMSAGGKPLIPPFNLAVLWPAPFPRHVYEFLSFDEFRLDLRHMMLDEMEALALWGSVAAFGCAVLLNVIRTFVSYIGSPSDEVLKEVAS